MRVPLCRAAWLVACCVAATAPARAQVPGTTNSGALPGVPAAAETQTFGSGQTTATTAPRATGNADAASLLGLKEPAQRASITLEQALDLARHENADIVIAAERIVQQEAQLRRAWAAFLPQLAVGGSYVLNCTGGGADVATCADRTAQGLTQDQLDQQAL